MSVSNYAVKWKEIKNQLRLVHDPLLRNIMLAEFRQRAIRDWGFDPEGKALNEKVVLDDWEKEMLEDINDFKSFGVDNRVEKRKQTEKEAIARMKQYIDNGGKYTDLPAELQNDDIWKIYQKAWNSLLDDIEETIRSIDKKTLDGCAAVC